MLERKLNHSTLFFNNYSYSFLNFPLPVCKLLLNSLPPFCIPANENRAEFEFSFFLLHFFVFEIPTNPFLAIPCVAANPPMNFAGTRARGLWKVKMEQQLLPPLPKDCECESPLSCLVVLLLLLLVY